MPVQRVSLVQCKKLQPEFGKAATVMTKENTATPVIFASINCGNEGRKVCNKESCSIGTLNVFDGLQ